MEESKFRRAFKEYREGNARLVEWIIGLVIGELILILSQHFYTKGIIFYLFLFFSFISILVAVSIMYALISSIDVDLYSAFLAVQMRGRSKKEDFGVEFDKRLGCIERWFINNVVLGKAYKCLFYFFLLSTAMMIVSIILNIVVQNIG